MEYNEENVKKIERALIYKQALEILYLYVETVERLDPYGTVARMILSKR